MERRGVGVSVHFHHGISVDKDFVFNYCPFLLLLVGFYEARLIEWRFNPFSPLIGTVESYLKERLLRRIGTD